MDELAQATAADTRSVLLTLCLEPVCSTIHYNVATQIL